MTQRELIHFYTVEWPAICFPRGWSTGDRRKRTAVLSTLVGRPVWQLADLSAAELANIRTQLPLKFPLPQTK